MVMGVELPLFLTLIFTIASLAMQNEMERSKYEEGRRQFEVLNLQSTAPRYGQCWKDAIITIQKGCKELSDIMQTRLSLVYLNCFLQVQGRPTYPCEWDEPLDECTIMMSDVDRSSLTTFFTHTHSICFFLESQVWHEETHKTISRLADSSAIVAEQLEEASVLQDEMIRRQNMTLENQGIIMDKAVNLSDIISSSTDNIHMMFREFKESTHEQRLLLNDVFDRLAKLQSMVIGEFSGFYSLIYYTLAVLICYLLTSTSRTSGARFWLFGVMTLNMIIERTFFMAGTKADEGVEIGIAAEADQDVKMYSNQWLCRKVAGVIGLLVLLSFAYCFKDLNVINNQLLLDIQKQNATIQKTLIDGNMLDRSTNSVKMIGDASVVTAAADTTGHDSDSSESDSGCSSQFSRSTIQTDYTYLPVEPHNELDSNESESYSTAITRSSRHSGSDLMEELRSLRSPSLAEMSPRIKAWAQTGYYRHSTPEKHEKDTASTSFRRGRSSTPQPVTNLDEPRYFLRPRKSIGKTPNPVLGSESPRTFSKKIQKLEQIAINNSILALQGMGRTRVNVEL